MRVYTPSANTYQEISQLLLKGEVVAIPTETVYGLAADALNPEAVEKIYEIKGRPAHNPLIIHVQNQQAAYAYVETNALAEKIMQAFWPGPLTLVLPKKDCIPSIVTAGLNTVGIRCPNHPAMRSILEVLQRPLAAPSANPSNYISPTEVSHVTRNLADRLKYALDGGKCSAGLESTILDLSAPLKPKLLRPGPIPLELLEETLGTKVEFRPAQIITENAAQVSSPGQLKLHYSPKTPLFLLEGSNQQIASSLERYLPLEAEANSALVLFSKEQDVDHCKISKFYLSETGSIEEVSQNLYSLLQDLDQNNFHQILISPIPDDNKWSAIRDRLTRAANQ